MSPCPRTGIARPECSCSSCLGEQIRQFRPALAEADPQGEIKVIRATRPEAQAERRPRA